MFPPGAPELTRFHESLPASFSQGFSGGRQGLINIFRPSPVVGNDGHDPQTRGSDDELGRHSLQTKTQHEMCDEGQKQANAKDWQGLLTASDERFEYWPF